MTDCNRPASMTLLIVLCIFSCCSVNALPEDRQQSVSISSDRAQMDDKKNITVYEGNVELTQGTLKILADKITIYDNDRSINKIIAIGQPAHYQQQPSVGKSNINAKANNIEFDFEKENILLRGSASVYQDGATLMGEEIDYDMRSEIIKAVGDDRIRMLIPPSNNK